MRKDTRVGVAIGLVLFLVLIVYAIAVPYLRLPNRNQM